VTGQKIKVRKRVSGTGAVGRVPGGDGGRKERSRIEEQKRETDKDTVLKSSVRVSKQDGASEEKRGWTIGSSLEQRGVEK